MASVNPLLALWRAGKPSLGGWLTTADPQIAEYLASVGFDEICVDQQHGIADGALLASLFRAIELHGVAPTTRVPANDFTAIGKALDVGRWPSSSRWSARRRRQRPQRRRATTRHAADARSARCAGSSCAPRTGSMHWMKPPASS